jgi:GNAT superfamily N-acetyltransferase
MLNNFESMTHLQPVTAGDFNAIRKLQPEDWSDIIPYFEYYVRTPFCHPLKALMNGVVAGTGVSIINGRSAWIGHIIVDKQFRNRGIGFQIVDGLLKDLSHRSVTTCSLIATELGMPVYIKAGFRPVSEYVFFERTAPWRTYPPPEHVVPFSENYRAAIYALDKKISGEDREAMLAEFITGALLYVDGDLLGYYLPALKEGMVYAETETAGIELMKVKYATANKAVLPEDNATGIQFLKDNGFTVTSSRGTRMVRGADLAWQPAKMYSRIAGNKG